MKPAEWWPRFLQLLYIGREDMTQEERQRRLLTLLAGALAPGIVIVLLAGLATNTPEPAYYVLVGSIGVHALIALWLAWAKQVKYALYYFPFALWLNLVVLISFSEPSWARISTAFFFLPILAAGILLGARAAILLTVATLGVGAAVAYWTVTEWPFTPGVAFIPNRNSVSLAVGMGLLGFYTLVAVLNIAELTRQTRAEVAKRRQGDIALEHERGLVQALVDASRAVSESLVFEEILDSIMAQVSKVIPGDAVNIMLIEGQLARIVRWRGYEQFGAEKNVANKSFVIEETPNLKWMIDTGQPVGEPNTRNSPNWVRTNEFQWLRSYVGVPIITKDKVVGFLNVDSAKPDFYSAQEFESLKAFASQVAVAVENSYLFGQVQKYAEDLEGAYLETSLALAKTLDVRDSYTSSHSEVTAARARSTLRAMGRSEREVMTIGLAAQLHDIGKIGIPDHILHKPGPLDAEEWEIMKQHPDIGADIVSRVKGLDEVSSIVRFHQEKYDGSGYPLGLGGDDIPLAARVLAVVDAFGAMTENRIYCDARSREEAELELKRCAGTDFDPNVVEAFLDVLQKETD
ncbi:MAG: HD domain-containing protein [Anaerolineales bacterium]|nr:HD domain-containing protein [Anaerolineales bacterium]